MSAHTAGRAAAVIGLTLLPLAVEAPANAVQLAGPARESASGGYRYWSFWEQRGESGEWSYATQGPSALRPGDGDVLGFRFALSEDSKDAAKPRGSTAFDHVCDGTDAKPGRKRIALRIDFGTSAHAPPGERPPRPRTECATVAEDATAADALASVAEPLRYDSAALLCAIDGYPRRGCGEQVQEKGKDAGEGASDGDDADSGGSSGGGSGPVAGVAAGVAAVAALAFAAVRRSRRRP
ncbi:SCO2322 family protein [Streptomyces marispadix]|uniref:SCO2322 family protein n=1 Tax=Streptomyces marispadix TaxID=2922868 RepID=A0ABS9SV59_9ACTN|nr:SCO2322 family protein [Streptomyces marispadix]MCH6160073.1 SCO2322 family protein [Streptomyces marispadix]